MQLFNFILVIKSCVTQLISTQLSSVHIQVIAMVSPLIVFLQNSNNHALLKNIDYRGKQIVS